ncbi:COQ9 family protein [Limobrevibacterium gyesilva]|uniref:COQ9 family protein n=1 Tax=Limobrevibacterium gyesilva TaxID=2991712 RepID=A0AA41YLB8_9PROT|nr:COQ9 family protein [Limobrevibacterium gyesilva]MCW3475964.1 COQ9 family protein [Limobrevibacterium gyesilva]
MIAPPERSAERDAAVDALLARVPAQGWTMATLRAALGDIGMDPLDAELLFPGGVADAIEAFVDLTDRRMEQDAAAADLSGLRVPGRVRAIVVLRLQRLRPHREAVRRALAVLALPHHALLAARCTARTVDTIWHAAGDRSADFSWYTKRAILTGVYGSTLLVWLRDDSEDDAATLAFLDRRLADVGRIGTVRKRLEGALDRLRHPCGRGSEAA